MGFLHPKAEELLQIFRKYYIPQDRHLGVLIQRDVYKERVKKEGEKQELIDCIEACNQAIKEAKMRDLLRSK